MSAQTLKPTSRADLAPKTAMHWREVLSRLRVPPNLLEFSRAYRNLRSLWLACPDVEWLQAIVSAVRSDATVYLRYAESEAMLHLLGRPKLNGPQRTERYRRIVRWCLVRDAFEVARTSQVKTYTQRRLRADVKCQASCTRRWCSDCRNHRERVHALVTFYRERDAGRGIYGRIRVYVRHAIDTWREESEEHA